jgi:hypothetical protein
LNFIEHGTTDHVPTAVLTYSGRNCGMEYARLSMQMRCISGGSLNFCRFLGGFVRHRQRNRTESAFLSTSPFTAANFIRRFPLSPLRIRSGWTRGTRESDEKKRKSVRFQRFRIQIDRISSNSATFRCGLDTVACHWPVDSHVTCEISTLSSFFSERR